MTELYYSLEDSDILFYATDQMAILSDLISLHSQHTYEQASKETRLRLVFATLGYLMSLILVWAWCQSSISSPLRSLNRAARQAHLEDEDFNVREIGTGKYVNWSRVSTRLWAPWKKHEMMH